MFFIKAHIDFTGSTQKWYIGMPFCRTRFHNSCNLTEKNSSVTDEKASKLCWRILWQPLIVYSSHSIGTYRHTRHIFDMENFPVSYGTNLFSRNKGLTFYTTKEVSCFTKMMLWYDTGKFLLLSNTSNGVDYRVRFLYLLLAVHWRQ